MLYESYDIAQFMVEFGEVSTEIIAGFLIANVHYISPFLITIGGMIFEIWFLTKFFQVDETRDEISIVMMKGNEDIYNNMNDLSKK